ncbi:hypothetical protein SDC9_86038 [bioreactor metagenome]|uniref:TonB C-terminal domain-containing protein n=1 Tax=bioreactor metagenome TaxID=1076179 RepID=A0A644ZET5_9ZZZZ
MKTKTTKPDSVIVIAMDEIPLPSTYGAAEMKFFIRKNTYRGAIIVLILLLLCLLINFVMVTVEKQAAEIKVAPITKTSLEELPPPDASETSDLPPPPDVVINTGPAARAGNPIPVPDAMIAPDLQDFATVDVADRASSKGGTGEDLGGFAGNIDWTGDKKVETTTIKDKEPEPDEFIPVEKEPQFDMRKLQGLVVYPDMARRAGIEGTVVVRALVDKTGKIVKAIVDVSDNKALDQAALKAMLDYGHATPAIMNKEPTTCWVSVPIVFRLK